MTTSARLSLFTPLRETLHTLFSQSELKNPLKLFLVPGVLASESLRVLLIFFLVPFFRVLVYLAALKWTWVVGLALWSIIAVSLALVLTPLEVITARCSVQLSGGSIALEGEDGLPSYSSVVPESATDGEREGEPVVCLRHATSKGPYDGAVDCFQKIVKEEGIRALWRGWWYTALFLVLGYASSPR